MPHHHHSSRRHHRGSLFIPPQYPSMVPFPMQHPQYSNMIPVPMIPFQIPNGYIPFLVPRTYIPFQNSITNSSNYARDNFREINKIGIIFITPKGILFIKNGINELTIPYGDKYSYESNETAVSRIFKEATGFDIDESKKTRERISYDRLRSTGIIAKFYLISTNQDNENDKVTYIKYNNDFSSLLYQKFVRSLFRDLIDKNDL